jgi:hypothetical protein
MDTVALIMINARILSMNLEAMRKNSEGKSK